jgi:hypothetical protein
MGLVAEGVELSVSTESNLKALLAEMRATPTTSGR